VATNHELFPFVLFIVYAISGPVRQVLMGRTAAASHGELGTKESS
jgi:hypothetical protein